MLDTLKALADPSRLRLVAILLKGEFTVQELTTILKVGQSKVSWHLKILTEAGVLTVKRQGTWSYYRVGGESLFFSAIRPAVEQGLTGLPEWTQDLTEVGLILEQRRRKSLEFFDRHARQWDDLIRTLLPTPAYQERLLALVTHGTSVVEVGFGTGSLLSSLAATSASVIGVDHSPAMVDEARRRLTDGGVSGVDLRLGEMTHLPLPDRSVECALLNMVLHHAADPPAVLAEVRRVLTLGGVLVLADLVRHERESAREQLADQWLGFEEAELCGWLKDAGFEQVVCQRLDGTSGQEAVLIVRGTKS